MCVCVCVCVLLRLEKGREAGTVLLLYLTLLKFLIGNARQLCILPLERSADGFNAAILEEATEVTRKIVLSTSSPATQ